MTGGGTPISFHFLYNSNTALFIEMPSSASLF